MHESDQLRVPLPTHTHSTKKCSSIIHAARKGKGQGGVRWPWRVVDHRVHVREGVKEKESRLRRCKDFINDTMRGKGLKFIYLGDVGWEIGFFSLSQQPP